MSSIPTKQIDGDIAVVRNVSIGGRASIRGSMSIGHNLKIKGWLDAPNIKGPNKGLYKTAAILREAYPNPQDGWWALVSEHTSTDPDKNKYLGQVYMAYGGVWVAQVKSDGTPLLGGNPSIDPTEYVKEVEILSGDINAVKTRVAQNESNIASLHTNQAAQGKQISTLESKQNEQHISIQALQTKQGTHDTDILKLKDVQQKHTGTISLMNANLQDLEREQTQQQTRIDGCAADILAIEDELTTKLDKASVVQVKGQATDKVMSQKAVTEELADISAGIEVININSLCGDKNYTLSTAIQALIDKEKISGTKYRKEGLVITYRRFSSPIVWECKQYHGSISNMTPTNERQWRDFSSGGENHSASIVVLQQEIAMLKAAIPRINEALESLSSPHTPLMVDAGGRLILAVGQGLECSQHDGLRVQQRVLDGETIDWRKVAWIE